jgi:hypothetical protein
VHLDDQGDVEPTVLKTCEQPPFTQLDEMGLPISWTTAQDAATGQCIRDEMGRCVQVVSDRTDIDRCPSAPYVGTSPMRILPTFQCFEQNIDLKAEDEGHFLLQQRVCVLFAYLPVCPIHIPHAQTSNPYMWQARSSVARGRR